MITVNNAMFTAKKYFERETKNTILENIQPKIEKIYDAKNHFVFSVVFDIEHLSSLNSNICRKMVSVNKNTGGIQELHGVGDYFKVSIDSKVMFDDETQELEDFLKYAKFEFDVDIAAKATQNDDENDTFEKIFGGSFEEKEKY